MLCSDRFDVRPSVGVSGRCGAVEIAGNGGEYLAKVITEGGEGRTLRQAEPAQGIGLPRFVNLLAMRFDERRQLHNREIGVTENSKRLRTIMHAAPTDWAGACCRRPQLSRGSNRDAGSGLNAWQPFPRP